MTITTFAELKTAIHTTWLNKTAVVTDAIATELIQLAEESIFQDLRVKEMEDMEEVTGGLSTTVRTLETPARFLEMIRLSLTDTTIFTLDYLTPEQLNERYSTLSGRPDFYTVIGNQIQFERIADTAYVPEMAFYQKPVALSGSNTTNALLTNYPSVYLYGSLMLAEPLLRNDSRIATWAGLYKTLTDKANETHKMSRYSGSSLSRQVDFMIV